MLAEGTAAGRQYKDTATAPRKNLLANYTEGFSFCKGAEKPIILQIWRKNLKKWFFLKISRFFSSPDSAGKMF